MTLDLPKRFQVRSDTVNNGVESTEVAHECESIDEALGFMYGAACAEDAGYNASQWSQSLYVIDMAVDGEAHSALCPCGQCVREKR